MAARGVLFSASFTLSAALSSSLRADHAAYSGGANARIGTITYASQLEEQYDLNTSIVKAFKDMESSPEIASPWLEYQDRLANILRQNHLEKQHARPYKTLIVAPVHDNPELANIFDFNMKRLMLNKAKDVFRVALFHIDGKNAEWSKYDWYQDDRGLVVRKQLGSGCKPQFWATISPSEAARYDYIWLMDEDIRLDFFNWDFYRAVLSSHQPLVSQPVVIAKKRGGKSTFHEGLRMVKPWSTPADHFVYAFEAMRSEVQVPVLSSKLWPALHMRLSENDLTSDFSVDHFWDTIAALSRVECGRTGVLAVNAAPVRHMDFHSLFRGTQCSINHDRNGRGISDKEELLIREALSGISCNVPSDWSKTCKHMDISPKVQGAIAIGMPSDEPLVRCLVGLRSNYTGGEWTEELKL